jgi:hypothetical protein
VLGLFYEVPKDLQGTKDSLLAIALILFAPQNYSPGLLEDMMSLHKPEIVALRDRLAEAGRQSDLKQFRKHMISKTSYLDVRPRQDVWLPWLNELFPKELCG